MSVWRWEIEVQALPANPYEWIADVGGLSIVGVGGLSPAFQFSQLDYSTPSAPHGLWWAGGPPSNDQPWWLVDPEPQPPFLLALEVDSLTGTARGYYRGALVGNPVTGLPTPSPTATPFVLGLGSVASPAAPSPTMEQARWDHFALKVDGSLIDADEFDGAVLSPYWDVSMDGPASAWVESGQLVLQAEWTVSANGNVFLIRLPAPPPYLPTGKVLEMTTMPSGHKVFATTANSKVNMTVVSPGNVVQRFADVLEPAPGPAATVLLPDGRVLVLCDTATTGWASATPWDAGSWEVWP